MQEKELQQEPLQELREVQCQGLVLVVVPECELADSPKWNDFSSIGAFKRL